MDRGRGRSFRMTGFWVARRSPDLTPCGAMRPAGPGVRFAQREGRRVVGIMAGLLGSGRGILNKNVGQRPSIAPAGIVLGIGMGGFLDGILLHQIFRFHNMISGKVPPNTVANMEKGMLADGLFHVVTWLTTLLGIALLWRALNRRHDAFPSGTAFVGYLLAGWGWFNLVEGIIDHHILNIHHVVERLGVSIWDWLFLASGVILVVLGHMLGRKACAAHGRSAVTVSFGATAAMDRRSGSERQ